VFHEEVISHGVLIPWISITQSHGPRELEDTLAALQQGMRAARRAIEQDCVNEAFVGEAPKPVFRTFNRCTESLCGRLYADAPKMKCCLTATEAEQR